MCFVYVFKTDLTDTTTDSMHSSIITQKGPNSSKNTQIVFVIRDILHRLLTALLWSCVLVYLNI